jgi:hypothetical protein
LYALRGQKYQTPAVVDKAVFLGLVTLVVMAVALELLSGIQNNDTQDNGTPPDSYRVYYHDRTFIAISIIVVTSAYLTTPGPTILTVDYATVLNNYYSWANFAGSLFMGSWIVLYLMVQKEAFLAVTFIGVIWLLLHARRNESMGVLALLGLDLFRNRFSLQSILSSWRQMIGVAGIGIVVLGQILAGSYRNGGSLFPDYVHGVYASYPGGAHNIYGTFQATISIFSHGTPHRFGTTFLNYPAQSIPTGFYALTGKEYLELYGNFLGSQYEMYLGGNYILNPYFADFGEVGLLVAGIILAVFATFVRRMIVHQQSNHFVAGCASVVVVASFRAFWYTQLAWADALQGFLAAFFVYLVIANAEKLWKGNREPSESMSSNTYLRDR